MKNPWIDLRPIPDKIDCLREWVTDEEWEKALQFGSDSRRREWLAWRALIRERVGRQTAIFYNGKGAPVLDPGLGWIGVSHCRGYVAVVWSESPCAIDIEPLSRNFAAVLSRCCSDAERSLADAHHPLFPAALWCAKEALYKYGSQQGIESALDFCHDLQITRCDLGNETMEGTIAGSDPVVIHLLRKENILAAYIL